LKVTDVLLSSTTIGGDLSKTFCKAADQIAIDEAGAVTELEIIAVYYGKKLDYKPQFLQE